MLGESVLWKSLGNLQTKRLLIYFKFIVKLQTNIVAKFSEGRSMPAHWFEFALRMFWIYPLYVNTRNSSTSIRSWTQNKFSYKNSEKKYTELILSYLQLEMSPVTTCENAKSSRVYHKYFHCLPYSNKTSELQAFEQYIQTYQARVLAKLQLKNVVAIIYHKI